LPIGQEYWTGHSIERLDYKLAKFVSNIKCLEHCCCSCRRHGATTTEGIGRWVRNTQKSASVQTCRSLIVASWAQLCMWRWWLSPPFLQNGICIFFLLPEAFCGL